jgi:SAM-dependent methyltransferase
LIRTLLTPSRRRGVEVLDDPGTPDSVRAAAMADVARSNRLFGGAGSVIRALDAPLATLPARALLIDVGSGMSDIPWAAQRAAARRGVVIETVALDLSESLLRAARGRVTASSAGDALRLPFATASADIVTCSQLLHHFFDADLRAIVAELHRVSRRWVVIGDLRRSWLAASGFWLASHALRFHPVTRRDGVTSVLRGFTASELRRLVGEVTGRDAIVRRTAFWRLSAVWTKAA